MGHNQTIIKFIKKKRREYILINASHHYHTRLLVTKSTTWRTVSPSYCFNDKAKITGIPWPVSFIILSAIWRAHTSNISWGRIWFGAKMITGRESLKDGDTTKRWPWAWVVIIYKQQTRTIYMHVQMHKYARLHTDIDSHMITSHSLLGVPITITSTHIIRMAK